MSTNKAVIALNGELKGSKEEYKKLIGEKDILFVAADGGALLLESIGFLPDVIIGDLDSLTKAQCQRYKKMGAMIIKYPVEKDETDGELALQYCKGRGLDNIIIIGFAGGRLDQQLANIFLLEYAFRNGMTAFIKEPGLEMGIIEKEKVFFQKMGVGLSLIPLDEKVSGVTITGCKYILKEESLLRYKTMGISNIIEQEKAVITVEKGLLLYVLDQSE
ncbi:MAG TPA: thiamine diphosphokinase [Candidatus Atribacteria bacterium]|nr:MAG: Thiamine pyrophosphokinase [Atribacteria bacterium 34_128]HAJ33728.1 thiamine diphosphokinase [Candidatus Atribacteria bacterium]